MPRPVPESTFIPVASPLRPLAEDELRQKAEAKAGLPIRTPDERAAAVSARVEAQANLFIEGFQAMQMGVGAAQETAQAVGGLRTGETAREQAGAAALQTAESVGIALAELPIETLFGGVADFAESTLNAAADFAAYVQDIPTAREMAESLNAPDMAGPFKVSDMPAELQVLAREQLAGSTPEDEAVFNFDVPEPTTAGGRFARSLVEFAVALVPAGKAVRLLGLGSRVAGAGRVAQGAVSVAEGAAAFGLVSGVTIEPSADRLSNLLLEHTELQNPVLDYLAHDEDETRFEGRIKNAIEGTAIGVPFEALMIPLRMFKRALRPSSTESRALMAEQVTAERTAVREFEAGTQRGRAVMAEGGERRASTVDRRQAQIEAPDEAMIEGGEKRIVDRRQQELGPPAKRELPGATRPLLPPRAGSAVGESLLKTTEIVRAIDSQTADELILMAESARGSTTDVVVLRQASKISTKKLLAIHPGDTNITAPQERALQMRREVLETLLRTSGENLAILENAGQEPSKGFMGRIAQFQQLYEAFTVRHQPVISESARITRLQRFRVLPKDFTVNLDALGEQMSDAEANALIEGAGGRDALRELAHKTAMLAGPDEVHAWWAARTKWGKGSEFARFIWYQGLLSGTALVKAIVGNTQYMAQLPLERAIAAQLPSQAVSMAPMRRVVTSTLADGITPDFVVQGEAATFAIALLDSIGGALRVGARTLREPAFETVAARSRLGGFRINPFSLTGEAAAAQGKTGQADIWRVLGRMTELPTRGLVALDDMSQALVAGAHVRSLALRESTIRGLQGKEAEAFMADFLLNVPDDVMRDAIRLGQEAGLRQDPAFFKGLILESNNNIVGAALAPFIRPGVNKATLFAERTPMALFAPSIRQALARGGADAQMAEAKILMGLMVVLAGADLAMKGKITGRYLGRVATGPLGTEFPPDSSFLNTNNEWQSYGPDTLLGFALSVGADMHAHSHVLQDETGGLSEKGFALFAAAARIGLDEIALRDVTRALGVIYEGGTDLSAGRKAASITERTAATFAVPQAVPVIQGVRAQLTDEVEEMRQLNSLWDRVLDRAGVVADFPRRDMLTGAPLPRPNPLYNAVPFAFTQPNLFGDVEKELVELSYVTGKFPFGRVQKTILSGGGKAIELNDRQYDRLQEIAGVELDRRGKFAEVMASDAYAQVPPDQRALQIQHMNTLVNQLARDQLLAEEEAAGDPDGLVNAILAEQERRVGGGAIPVLP